MRRWGVAAVAIGLLGLFVLLRAPASVVAAVLETACDGRCALVAIEGSLWRGSGELRVADTVGRWHPAGPLAWRWMAGALWAGEMRYELRPSQGEVSLSVNFHEFQADAHALKLPASLLAVALPTAMLGDGVLGDWQISGHAACAWRKPDCLLDFSGQWQDAHIKVINEGALGDYQIKLTRQPSDPRTQIEWKTLHGPLWLNAQAHIDGQRISIEGEAWAEGEDKTRLENYLRPLGPYDPASGRYRVRFSGDR